jgi:hypothetical protein
MRHDDGGGQEQQGLGEKARRVGMRHLVVGFLVLLLLLFLISWCSLPG